MIRLVLALLLVAVLLYGGVEAAPIIKGPHISLTSPVLGVEIIDGAVSITGTAKRAESLQLNGGPLLIEENGNFAKEITLPRGGAVLSLVATDRFGRTDSLRQAVFVP